MQETDLRSTFGRNTRFALSQLGADSVEMADPNNFTYCPVPQEEESRVTLINKCLEMRAGRLERNLTQKEITSIIDSISI